MVGLCTVPSACVKPPKQTPADPNKEDNGGKLTTFTWNFTDLPAGK